MYSTDLSVGDADLKVLARMVNLSGQEGRDELPNFSARNFEFTTATPEPSSLFLILAISGIAACWHILRRKRFPRSPKLLTNNDSLQARPLAGPSKPKNC